MMYDDGFGMTDDEEIALWGKIDREGNVVEKFKYSKDVRVDWCACAVLRFVRR